MAVFRIYRVYDVPGKTQYEATDHMMEAIALGVEKDFHVSDRIRPMDGPSKQAEKFSLEPPKGWGKLLLDQLLGRTGNKKR